VSVLEVRDPGHETVVVSFAHRGAAGFAYYRLLDALPVSRVFVRDSTDRWYNGAVPGLGDTVAEMAETVRAAIGETGATRVVTVGSSMGGYAALLFGGLLRADRVVALSPQTLLDRRFPLSPPADVTPQVPDLRSVVAAAVDTDVLVVTGADDLVDAFYVGRLAGLPTVRSLAVPDASHTFADELHRRERLTPVLHALLAGEVPEDCRTHPCADVVVAGHVDDAVLRFHDRDPAGAAAAMAPVCAAHPEWAGAQFLLGRALLAAHRPVEAEAAFRAAAAANPGWFEPPRELGRALLAQDRAETAEPFLRQAIAMRPSWAEAHVFLADCVVRRGDEGEGRALLARALELKPALAGEVERRLSALEAAG